MGLIRLLSYDGDREAHWECWYYEGGKGTALKGRRDFMTKRIYLSICTGMEKQVMACLRSSWDSSEAGSLAGQQRAARGRVNCLEALCLRLLC